MKPALLEFKAPGWKETVEQWKAAGLISVAPVLPIGRIVKTNRTTGKFCDQIRSFARARGSFCLDEIVLVMKDDRNRVRSQVAALVKSGELKSSAAGLGAGHHRGTIYTATNLLKK